MALGLCSDENIVQSDRLTLWNDFNHAWLTLLQKQLELTDQAEAANPQLTAIARDSTLDHPAAVASRTAMGIASMLTPGQTILSRPELEALGDELVRMCDTVMHRALVDYQIGVAEERIIQGKFVCESLILLPCETFPFFAV